MKKPYSLDYGIERDTDRLKAVEDILDKLETNPSSTELEQMGSYILYGKDENGLNAYQRGEMLADRRYASFRTKADKNISLDALLENPLAGEQDLIEVTQKIRYIAPKTTITRPKYNKKTGALIDPGDSDIPGMRELWECIDRNEHWIAVLEGKVPPQGDEMLFDNPYRLYRLKHALVDMRRHQYYLKDAYKPTIHFLAADHPKRRYINWNSDSFYWIAREEWEKRVNNTYFPVSKKIEDYETKNEGKEVKWVVRRHTFNWEDPKHIAALISNYAPLKTLLWDKLDTDGHTLLIDFERYRALAHLTPSREFILDQKLNQLTLEEIQHAVKIHFGLEYGLNRINTITASEIPKAIAAAVTRHRIIIETPKKQCKICKECGRLLPKNPIFFCVNNSRHDKFAIRCKECERKLRVEKGGQSKYDRRNKETPLLEMQARQA